MMAETMKNSFRRMRHVQFHNSKTHLLEEGREDDAIQSAQCLSPLRKRRRTHPPSRLQQCVDFVNEVSRRFQNRNTFSMFINLMLRKETHKISDSELVSEIAQLFGSHSDLTHGLRQLLLQQQEEHAGDLVQEKVAHRKPQRHKQLTKTEQRIQREWHEKGMMWTQKIQSKLRNSDEYSQLLRCLYDYTARQNIGRMELISTFEKKLGTHSELIVNLREFLDHINEQDNSRKRVTESDEELYAIIDDYGKQPKGSSNKLSSREEAQRLINENYFAWEDERHLLDLQLKNVRSVANQCCNWMRYMTAEDEEDEVVDEEEDDVDDEEKGYLADDDDDQEEEEENEEEEEEKNRSYADEKQGKQPRGRDGFLSVLNKACIQAIYRQTKQGEQKLDYSFVSSKIHIKHRYEKNIWKSLGMENPRIVLPMLLRQFAEVEEVLKKKIKSHANPPTC